MNKINYGILCDKTIEKADASNRRPKLLLHVCCAPCSSYCLEYLEGHFDIDLYFYNPNITDKDEFIRRLRELERFVRIREGKMFPIISPEYNPKEFLYSSSGYESSPEGGERCSRCYRLRLKKTAEAASSEGYDYFTTTLSVSPHKNSSLLNDIGRDLELEYGVEYLYSDFKKKGGYARSVFLSKRYGLYRQDYCGCVYSQNEAAARRKERSL